MTTDVRFREMTSADVPGGLRLSRAAGWNQREEDWRMLLELAAGRFHVAEAQGLVVGTGGAACYGRELAWICMILVDAEHRGHGIATRLMERVLEGLEGFAAVGLDATPAGRPVYARLGFVETGELRRLGTVIDRAPDRSAPTRRLAPADLPSVLELDRQAFGADRAAVLRWLLEHAPESAWCAEDDRGLAGYCFGRRGHHSRQIGPLVALGLDTARALVVASLTAAVGDRVVIDPPATKDWLAALQGLGFQEQRPLYRMYRGRPPAAARPELQLAILGPEFG